MKNKRQNELLRLISVKDITTQEELLEELILAGFTVTQATVSRDIRELKIIKTAIDKGKYKYVKSEQPDLGRFATILARAVESIDYAMNIVVVKAFSGMASAAGAAIDSMELENVVGSVAGDDTLILITKTEEKAKKLCEELSKSF